MTRSQGTFWTSTFGVIVLLSGYGFAHALMRLLASWNLGENDPASLLRAQNFSLLDPDKHVFDGLVTVLTDVFGPSAIIFQVLRYGLLTLALLFVFLSARKISGSGLWALLTVEAYALIYQISWRFHEGFTETLVTMLAVSGLFWAMLQERWRLLWLVPFLLLGVLSDFWFGIFLLAFIPAMAAARWGRLPEFIMLCAALIVSFVFNEAAFMDYFFSKPSEPQHLKGGFDAFVKVIAFLSPLLPLLFLIFGFRFLTADTTEPVAVIARATFFAATIVVAAALFTGKAAYGEHALTPVFMLTPIWFMAGISKIEPNKRLLSIFTGLCIALMATAFVARAANLYVLDPVCQKCYFGIPYGRLARALSVENETAPDRIITLDPRVAGNLKAHWPSKTRPFFEHQTVADVKRSESVWLVWDSARYSDKQVSDWLKNSGVLESDAHLARARTLSIPWQHLWRADGYRKSEFKVARWQNTAAPLDK